MAARRHVKRPETLIDQSVESHVPGSPLFMACSRGVPGQRPCSACLPAASTPWGAKNPGYFLEPRGELTVFRCEPKRAVGVTPGPPTHGREPGHPFFGEIWRRNHREREPKSLTVQSGAASGKSGGWRRGSATSAHAKLAWIISSRALPHAFSSERMVRAGTREMMYDGCCLPFSVTPGTISWARSAQGRDTQRRQY